MKKRLIAAVLALIISASLFGCEASPEETKTETNKETSTSPSDGNVLTVHVETNGSDETGDGTKENPFASVFGASKYIRTVSKSDYDGIDVVFGNGEFRFGEPLYLNPEDSGTESCPIRYIGAENTVLTGGVSFSLDDFSPVNDEFAAYLKDEAKEHVVQIDMKQFGFTEDDYERLPLRTPNEWGPTPAFSLYVGGERKLLARYPNEGFVLLKDVSENEDGTWNFFFDSKEHRDALSRWHTTDGVYLAGYFQNFYFDDYAKVVGLSVKTGKVRISLEPEIMHKVPDKNLSKDHVFYWFNVAEELDMPGEYYIDENLMLYYYPSEDDKTETFKYSVIDDLDMISCYNVEYVSFENIIFENTALNMLRLTGSHDTVKNCVFRNIGGTAINAEGNYQVISDNEIYSVGKSHIDYDGGGDIETLTPCYSFITNNYIHDVGQIGKCALGKINSTVGLTISHNVFSDMPINALMFDKKCSGNTVEYNIFENIGYETDDMSVIYVTRAYSNYGNVFRYNYFGNIVNILKDEFPEAGRCGVHALYFDGQGAGHTVYGNIFNVCSSQAVVVNGGRNCNVYDNVFLDCEVSLRYPSYTDTFFAGDFWDGYATLGGIDIYSGAWAEKYPELKDINFENDPEKVAKDDSTHFSFTADSVIKNNFSFLVEGTPAENGNMEVYEEVYRYSEVENVVLTFYKGGEKPDWKAVAAEKIPNINPNDIGIQK